MTTEERFWSKVDKNGPVPAHCPELGPCWLWLGSADRKGYGWFYLRREGRKQLSKKAPRFAWECTKGPVNTGLWVLHRCDRPQCVNPEHLYLGTPARNTADMIEKGRHKPGSVRGEEAGCVVLTESDVRTIRVLHSEGVAQRELARRYGVSHQNIRMIVRRRTWAHVT